MLTIRTGSVQEAVDLARRMPDFSNPYHLDDPDTPLPRLDHVLIAEHGGIPVGFRAGYRYSTDTFAVWLAAVLPEYRRQGIAGALYRSQKDWLKSEGYRFLRTHTRNANRVMLKILVDKGYGVVDVVRYDDVGRNKVVFLKDLRDEGARKKAGPLVVGLLNAADRDRDPELWAWLRDITISSLRFKYVGRIIEDSSVDRILDQACRSDYEHCLILAHGAVLSHAWQLRLVPSIEAWARDHEFLVAGTILRQEGSCCGLSPDGLLVNLAAYERLARPVYGEPGSSQVRVALPVSDGVEEAGCGGSLLPSGETADRSSRLPGWGLISASLAAGIPVGPAPDAISETLLSVAPENDRQSESLKQVRGEAIATTTLSSTALGTGAFRFLTGVQRQVRNSRRGIFVWNFESYDDVNEPPADFESPISTLYSVAAGLKTSRILETHGFDEKTRLVYFDYSEPALRFKRLLHEQWDGRDYPGFLQHLFETIRPGDAFYQLWGGLAPQDMTSESVREAWSREVSRWGGEAVIRENWRRTRDLRVDYVLCNLLEDPGPLLARMDDRPNAVIWWSNVFFTIYSNWFHSIAERRAIYQGFIRRLTERSQDLLLYGNDSNNLPVTAVRVADYARVYLQAEDDALEPRIICAPERVPGHAP